jgi:hypothetical protein
MPQMTTDALVLRADWGTITGDLEVAAAADLILVSGREEEVVGMILRHRIRNLHHLHQRKVKVGGLAFGPVWREAQPLGTRQRLVEVTTDKKHVVPAPAPAGEQVPLARHLLADQIPSQHPLRDMRAPGLVQQIVGSSRKKKQMRKYY